MSDDQIATDDGNPKDIPKPRGDVDPDRDTNTHAPTVEGGQPAVGDNRPRSTEF